jgi:acyl-coenzyme A synthetase/AMP-(fatty) acid ligase
MPEESPVNIASHLPAMARVNPHGLAVVTPGGEDREGRAFYSHLTLKQLDDASSDLAHGLEAMGITKGTRAVLMVTPGLDFFSLTFALFKVGAIPVMIDPGMGLQNLGTCISESEPYAFIGVPRAQAARILLGWGKRTIKIVITAGPGPLLGGTSLKKVIQGGSPGRPYPMAPTAPGDVAAILFTSGSTGISKGAVYTHGIFDAQVELLKQVYGIKPGEMDLATFPLFALFGPALGMTAIIPHMDASRPAQADPRRIFQAIEDFGPTNMFASPALINKLGRYGEKHGLRLPSLQRVISAGAPASPASLERFALMLSPGVEIFTPYGATEALPVCNVGSGEIIEKTASLTRQGRGACVGRPVPGMEVEIMKITDGPIDEWQKDLSLPAGEIGEIAVKGPVATREYFNRPDATALAKIPCPGGGFFHRMGDVGYRDEEGRIWFCGRKSHRVETPGGTLFTIPCEGVFNAHPAVFRTALVGVSREGRMEPVLCVEIEKSEEKQDLEKIKADLLELGSAHAHTRGIKTILFHPRFPVDVRHNAKIFREKLAAWAGRKLR